MFPIHPPTSKAYISNCLWDELVLKANSIDVSFVRNLIEDFWPKVVSSLGNIRDRDIEIAGPTQEAWFHVRRASYNDSKEIDVLRLKSGFLPVKDVERVRLLAGSYSGIIHASWRHWNPEARHDNAFLSFLQKLSVLRGRDRIYHNEFLGQTPKTNYNMDPGCQKAYKIMMTPNSKWSKALCPWFEHISSTKMDSKMTHEYAHWFGHILSGWPNDNE